MGFASPRLRCEIRVHLCLSASVVQVHPAEMFYVDLSGITWNYMELSGL